MIDFLGISGSIFSILTVFWTTKKDVKGIYCGIISNIFWISFGFITNFWYIVISNSLFLYFGLRGLKYWRDNE